MTARLDDLLAELRKRFPADADPGEVEAYLAGEGFDRRQIGEILERFFPHPAAASASAAAAEAAAAALRRDGERGFRVLAPYELGRFAPEAWVQLLALRYGGMLSAVDLELVIERMLANTDGPIALDDLRAFMESVGL